MAVKIIIIHQQTTISDDNYFIMSCLTELT